MSDMVWIRTVLDIEAHQYVVTLEADEDHAARLDTAAAHEWAGQVLAAVAAAHHDAMVVAQIQGMGFNAHDVAAVVGPLRADRPATYGVSAVEHLSLTPGVSAFTGRAFLYVNIDGAAVGQWELPAAREHATVVLEALAMADLDTAYLRVLMGPAIGLDYPMATQVVGRLGEFEDAT